MEKQEEFKTFLEGQKKEIEERVKQITADASGQVEGKLAEMKAAMEGDVAKINESLKSLEDAQKQAAAQHVPGEDGEKGKWSWQNFAFGALNASKGAGNGIKDSFERAGAGYEFERLTATAQAHKRDAIAGDGTQGGYLIPEEQTDEIVGLTIAKMPIMDMGVTSLTGLYGDLPIPRITSRNTGYWVGETEAPTESTGAFGQFTLRPKKGGAFTKYSRRLAYQTRGTADTIIKGNLTDALSLLIHNGFLQGLGTESQPKGLLTQTGTTTSTAIGTNGGRFRVDHAARMAQALDVANELTADGNFGYIMRPEVLGGMKRERIPQFTGQTLGQGQPINPMAVLMSQAQLEEAVGYKMRTTTQLAATNSKGTSSTVSSVIFGNWKQFYAGFWRGLEVRVSEHASDASGNSAFLKDQFFMLAIQEVDCNVGRTTAFTTITDAECTESLWTNG